MGVNAKNIVLFGYELDTDLYDKLGGYEEFDGLRIRDSEVGDLTAVYDGRGGRYFYIGYLVARSNDSRTDGMADFSNRIKLSKEEYENKNQLEDIMKEYKIQKSFPPSFHIFTHYR